MIFNGQYAFTFGKKMQFSFLSRLTYAPRVLGTLYAPWNYAAGIGIRFNPFYNDRIAFILDITPIVGYNEISPYPLHIFVPLSMNIHVNFSSRIALATDFGLGQDYNHNNVDLLARGNIGIIINFGKPANFKTGY